MLQHPSSEQWTFLPIISCDARLNQYQQFVYYPFEILFLELIRFAFDQFERKNHPNYRLELFNAKFSCSIAHHIMLYCYWFSLSLSFISGGVVTSVSYSVSNIAQNIYPCISKLISNSTNVSDHNIPFSLSQLFNWFCISFFSSKQWHTNDFNDSKSCDNEKSSHQHIAFRA